MDRRRFFAAAASTSLLVPGIAQAQSRTSEESQYVGSIVVIAGMMSWFFDESSKLTSNFEAASLMDEEWRINILGTFAVPRAAQSVMQSITPPDSFAECHGYLRDSIDYAVLSGEAMREGVLNLDATSIQSAGELLGQSSDLISQATAALPNS